MSQFEKAWKRIGGGSREREVAKKYWKESLLWVLKIQYGTNEDELPCDLETLEKMIENMP